MVDSTAQAPCSGKGVCSLEENQGAIRKGRGEGITGSEAQKTSISVFLCKKVAFQETNENISLEVNLCIDCHLSKQEAFS